MKTDAEISRKYLDSPACTCDVCVSFCRRPGWWTVEEAARAMDAGYGTRMMLEMGPANAFAVLSPAFKGAEQDFATNIHAHHGCTFLVDKRCQLHGTGLQPLECRCSCHDRPGMGERCHADLGRQWNSPSGRALVVRWSNQTEFWQRHPRPR